MGAAFAYQKNVTWNDTNRQIHQNLEVPFFPHHNTEINEILESKSQLMRETRSPTINGGRRLLWD